MANLVPFVFALHRNKFKPLQSRDFDAAVGLAVDAGPNKKPFAQGHPERFSSLLDGHGFGRFALGGVQSFADR